MVRFLPIVLLMGCASVEPVAVTGPSGGTAYSMSCAGGGLSMEDCFVKASEMCPAGYDVVSSAAGRSRGRRVDGALTIECR